ncbi:MAG TPA: AgmX/PglI C-terminal domain-containing protein [Agitococcus sp.]|nr:AgmX/PglI C-terminal domain-containing protein [Agitococcus sp.]HNH44881.1 AgmX/PglI C-terminal domain-containing protein [Agitococcus sp.]
MNDDLDPKLQHLYRQIPKEQPSQAVDSAILQAAQQSIANKTYWRPVWGIAASVVMMSSMVWYWQAQQPQELARAVAVSASLPKPMMESVAKPVEQDEQAVNLLSTDNLSAAPTIEQKPAKKSESLAKTKAQNPPQVINELKELAAAPAPVMSVEKPQQLNKQMMADKNIVAKEEIESPLAASTVAKLEQTSSSLRVKQSLNKTTESHNQQAIERIRRVFEKNFVELNSVYQQALKEDANLEQGVVHFKLIIDEKGTVASCMVASSTLNNPELEAKFVEIVKKFNFGEATEEWKGTYPVYFDNTQ